MNHSINLNCVVICILVLFSVAYSILSVVRHDRFQSGAFDLGIYDQAVWRYSRFLDPYNTVKERLILGDHLTLNLPLLSPLFWIYPDARMLLIFQAFMIVFSGLAVFRIARLRIQNDLSASAVTVAYLLFYGIQYAVYFDFHPVTYGMALLVWLAYALETKRRLIAAVLVILVLTTQENMGIALIGLSFFYLFRKDRWKQGVVLAGAGLAYSLVSTRVIAYFSPVGFQYQPDISLNPEETVRRFADSPEKLEVWKFTLLSFGGLPLLYPPALAAALLDLYQYLATGPVFFQMWSVYKHHRVMLAPFLAFGTIELLRAVGSSRLLRMALSWYLLITTVLIQFYLHLPLNKLTKNAYWQREIWMENADRLFARIPAEASLAAQQNYVPHLSHRREIYLVYPRKKDVKRAPCGQKLCWWLEWGGTPEFLVADTRPDQWLTQILESNENWLAAIANMERNGNIIPADSEGDLRLYRVVDKSPDL